MKVLHIINVLATGGAEKLLVEMLPEFEKRGIDVYLLIFDGKDTIFLQILKHAGFKKYQSLGVDINLYNPLIIFKLIPFFKKFDVIHTHLFQPQYFASIAKWLSGSKTKLVTTEHNTINRRRDYTLFKILDRIIYSKYDKIIAVADITYATLRDHLRYPDSDHIVMIPNGIKVNDFYEVEPANIESLTGLSNEGLKFIAMVARFIPPKDQSTVIKSLKRLPDHFHLLLVGEGPAMEDCKKLALTLGVFERVHFLGRRKDVAHILKSADVIVMSSFNEGLSLSSLEGLASGKPVLASDVIGLREVVQGAGILFEYGNDEQLASQIYQVCTDSNLYDRTVQACLSRVQQYDISIMVDRYIDLYRSL